MPEYGPAKKISIGQNDAPPPAYGTKNSLYTDQTTYPENPCDNNAFCEGLEESAAHKCDKENFQHGLVA